MSFLQDYEPVEDRLRHFWEDHPEGRVETTLIGDTDGRYVVQAWVYRTDESTRAAATGLAMERETDRGVNATSALENCETSAIGRALANLGYAAKGKRPSREEMSKVSSGPSISSAGGHGRRVDKTSSAPSHSEPAGATGKGTAGSDAEPGEVSASPGRRFTKAANKCDHSVGTYDDGSGVRCLACGKPMGAR